MKTLNLQELKAVALLAQSAGSRFQRDRRNFEERELISYLEVFLKESADSFENVPEVDKLLATEFLFQIYSNLAFIRWKLLKSFYSDSFYIAENYIRPINKILGQYELGNSNRSGIIAYIPALNPVSLASASSLGSRGIVESFNDPVLRSNLGARKLLVFIQNPSIKKDYIEVVGSSVGFNTSATVVFFRDFKDLISAIDKNNTEAVLYDYFTMPWVFLPVMLPKVRFVYLSFGFNLALFNHTKGILAYGMKDQIYSDYIAKEFGEHGSKVRWIPGRVESTFPNLDPGLVVSEGLKSRINAVRDRNKFIVVSLCRGTKVSDNFLEFLHRLIKLNAEVGVIIAGPGVEEISAPWAVEARGRVEFLGQTPPFQLLSIANLYLETWPEHQGHAAIEAMHFNVPVLCVSGQECDHILLAERSSNAVYPSSDALLLDISSFLSPGSKTDAILSDQSKILKNVYCDPIYFWRQLMLSVRS